MADIHPTPAVFERDLAIVRRYGITTEWKRFDVPWEILLLRDEKRAIHDPAHRQPEHVLALTYEAFHAADAWWRTLPPEQIEIVRP